MSKMRFNINKMSLVTFVGVCISTISNLLPSSALAQADTSGLNICFNAKSGRIFVQGTCPQGTTLLSAANFAKQLGLVSSNSPTAAASDWKVTSCQTVTGSASGASFNGELGVAVQCKKGTMLARSINVSDNSNATPSLSSETVLKNKNNVPIGTQIVMRGTPKSYYVVTVGVECCQ